MISAPASTVSRRRPTPSPQLLDFTAGFPYERQSILDFALRVAEELEPGCRLLDVGAGNSPYRELFTHLQYATNDWQHSLHPGAQAVDHVGPAHAIPVADAQFDAVLCTQVLEHVPDPGAVLSELHRVLVPGGRLYLTLPLVWELHELPFDFFRYTPHGLHSLLSAAGFARIDIRPRNDCFQTLAQLLENAATVAGRYPDGHDQQRGQAAAALKTMASQVAGFSGLDARNIFPLGYSVAARRPGPTELAAPTHRGAPQARAALGLDEARGFLTVSFAREVLAEPYLLADYAGQFRAGDDASLVIYAPESDPPAALTALRQLLAQVGADGPNRPDMIALAVSTSVDEPGLAAAADAVLSLMPPSGPFAGLPWAHPGSLAQIRSTALTPSRDVRPATEPGR